jgi:hypothetical protein
MNNPQLVDLSANEMLTVAGGEADKLTCFLLGVGTGAGLLMGPGGWVGSALAWNEARTSGCL